MSIVVFKHKLQFLNSYSNNRYVNKRVKGKKDNTLSLSLFILNLRVILNSFV